MDRLQQQTKKKNLLTRRLCLEYGTHSHSRHHSQSGSKHTRWGHGRCLARCGSSSACVVHAYKRRRQWKNKSWRTDEGDEWRSSTNCITRVRGREKSKKEQGRAKSVETAIYNDIASSYDQNTYLLSKSNMTMCGVLQPVTIDATAQMYAAVKKRSKETARRDIYAHEKNLKWKPVGGFVWRNVKVQMVVVVLLCDANEFLYKQIIAYEKRLPGFSLSVHTHTCPSEHTHKPARSASSWTSACKLRRPTVYESSICCFNWMTWAATLVRSSFAGPVNSSSVSW